MSHAPKGFNLRLETFPMPSGRADKVSAIGTVLESGGIHKLTLEAGKDLRVLRWAKDELDGLPPELLTDSVMAAARNAEMDDCLADDNPTPMELLFRGFAMVSKKGLKPVNLAVRSSRELLKWLKVDPLADTGEVFCVPILQNSAVPEHVLLLIAAHSADPSEIEYSVKLDMEDTK